MTVGTFGWHRSVKRLGLWARRVGLGRKLAYAVVVFAILCGSATVATMMGSSLLGPDPNTVDLLLNLDAVALLLLGAIVTWRLVALGLERRQGTAGSRLHLRLVVLFSAVAVTPAILVAVFSALYLNFTVQAWFNERVRTAIEESRVVAHAYLNEHQQSIRADALAMANDLNRDAMRLGRDLRLFSQIVSTQAAFRNLPEALVIDGEGRVVARSQFSIAIAFELVPLERLRAADEGQIVVLTNDQDDRVRALVKLNAYDNAYLLVGRFIEPGVLDHIERTEFVAQQYNSLNEKRKGIQIQFFLTFVAAALLLLLAAVWVGLALATRLARPVSNLIVAAERVGKGDLTARVASAASADELGTLSRAFNRMTNQLELQQLGLVEANRQLDERRRFTEAVLTGVSSGVIGLDREGRVNLPNRSASDLLAMDLDQSSGSPLGYVVPEMAALLADALARPERMHQAELQFRRNDNPRVFLVRIVAERRGDEIIGYVVTFDDITELQSAQRKAAWADIARRIAHEIKNPLTPIQLSAERLQRKYLKEIKSDPETFVTCTETIIRQVEDIGRMVDEFSSFARMPQAILQRENLSEICRQTVFLERNRAAEITFDLSLPEDAVFLRCDGRQVGRALTNLLKNAAESIGDRKAAKDQKRPRGHVHLRLTERGTTEQRIVTVEVEDNGRGLPRENRERLTEPYVTSRDKGTGLGLAIVKKIMEDHHGDLVLADGEEGGARVSLIFRESVQSPFVVAPTSAPEEDGMKVATRILAHGS